MQFARADIVQAIQQLKGGKAVPDLSMPAEIWKLCSDSMADMLVQQLNEGTGDGKTKNRPRRGLEGKHVLGAHDIDARS